MTKGVWLVTGAQAAGKSTTAELLASQFDRGVHVRGGQFYRWAVRGWVHVGDVDRPDEARRLLDLRYRLSALVADEYCRAGFTTVVQDNIFGHDVLQWLRAVEARPRRLVVLRPSVEVVAERERQRTATTGKVAYRPGEMTVADLGRGGGGDAADRPVARHVRTVAGGDRCRDRVPIRRGTRPRRRLTRRRGGVSPGRPRSRG